MRPLRKHQCICFFLRSTRVWFNTTSYSPYAGRLGRDGHDAGHYRSTQNGGASTSGTRVGPARRCEWMKPSNPKCAAFIQTLWYRATTRCNGTRLQQQLRRRASCIVHPVAALYPAPSGSYTLPRVRRKVVQGRYGSCPYLLQVQLLLRRSYCSREVPVAPDQ